MSACCASNSRKGGFDLAVIGAGSAGFSAAITAAEQGARVALIGHGTIGGTCVNGGCVPSKTLIRAAESLHHAQAAARFAGIRGEARLDDWSSLVAQKDELVSGLRQAKYVDLLPAYNTIAYIEAGARLSPEGVHANGDLLRAGKMIVATGASAAQPSIPGIDDIDYLTSTSALELEALPISMLVIGGGYIGCELAQLFARAGVKVTLVTRSRLLPEGEPEISEALARYLGEEGIRVRTGLTYRRIRRSGGDITLDVEREGVGEALEAEAVLVATGRRPNTDGLGLADVDVALGARGGIQVDDHLRTSNAAIYAAGDVTGRHQFVYVAAYGAKLAALNALNGDSQRYDATAMPMVTFTDPQVASVGLTEAAARAAGHDVKTSVLPLDAVPRALAARDTRGLIKQAAYTGQLRQAAASPCNPCAAANPCNPCAANPCAAAADPCNPCAVVKPANPCAANPCNPCAATNPCNPCAATKATSPGNPCAATKIVNPCNPCAATKPANPCNPCAAKNPCNPCAATNPCKPGAANSPCNPGAVQAAVLTGEAATVAQEYQGWDRVNTAPYVSATHGSRYVNNYPGPEAAEAYREFEEIGAMAAGGRIAKDSFTVSPDGRVGVGPLFIMEKMAEGFNEGSDDWRYAMIMPDGSLFGVTNGPGSQNVQFCAECHAIVADDQDSLYFLPEEFRVTSR